MVDQLGRCVRACCTNKKINRSTPIINAVHTTLYSKNHTDSALGFYHHQPYRVSCGALVSFERRSSFPAETATPLQELHLVALG